MAEGKQTCKWDPVFEVTEMANLKFSSDADAEIKISSDDDNLPIQYEDKTDWRIYFDTPEPTSLIVDTHIVVDGRIKYTLKFTESTWQETGRLARYYLEIPMSYHGLGFMAEVDQVERNMGNSYENVWYAYERYANGIIVLYADEKYNGRVIIGGSA